jgi:hypothetical protein
MILHFIFNDTDTCHGEETLTYTSPFGFCYNPYLLLNNRSLHWPYRDILDQVMKWDRHGVPTLFKRTYYTTTDGSCGQNSNAFMISTLPFCEVYGYSDGPTVSIFDWLTSQHEDLEEIN